MEKSPCLFTIEEGAKKATFEVTRSCNYSCKHCCTNSSIKVPEKMDTSMIRQAFDNLSSHDVKTVYISGGEPFFRKDIREIIGYALGLPGIKKINIASNGSLINRSTSQWLSQLNKIGTVLISVDGHTPEIHDRFRLAEGGFEDAINAIQNLVNASVSVRFGTSIWRENKAYLRELAALAASLSVYELSYNWLMPAGRGASSKGIELPQNEYLPVGREIERIKAEYLGLLSVVFHRFKTVDESYNDCPGGESYFHVLDDGRVSPCSWIAKLDASFTSKDKITDKPLESILQGEEIQRFRMMVRQRRASYGPGCPATTLAEEGTYLAFDPLKKDSGIYFRLDKDGQR